MLTALLFAVSFTDVWNEYKSYIVPIVGWIVISLANGSVSYPGPNAGMVQRIAHFLLDLASFLTKKDSVGTLKMPVFGQSKDPNGPDSAPVLKGFIRFYALYLIALITLATLCFSGAARAAEPPKGGTLADVAPSDDPPPPPPVSFGGCVGAKKNVCFAPSVSLSIVAINLSTKKIEGSFLPGVGYGMTVNPGKWTSFGFAAFFVVDPGAQQAGGTLMAKFLNDYFHVGISKGFIGDKSWRLPIAVGFSVPVQ